MVRVFVDLDDTLVDFSEHGPYSVPGDTEGPYALAHGGKEFLQALMSIPGMQLHFYSGGPSSRNLGLVRQILQEILQEEDTEQLMINVFSQEHLIPGDPGDPEDPPKKQLSALPMSDLDLEQSIVVDDTAYYYAAEGEERNFLQIYSCHCDRHSHYAGKVFNMRRSNRLIRALGMILRCLEIVSSNGCSFVEALQSIQWDPETRAYRHNESNGAEIYELGLEAMRWFNPELQLLDEEGLGIWPWSGRILEESLGHEPDSHFPSSNFFEKDQIARLFSSYNHMVVAWHSQVQKITGEEHEEERDYVQVEVLWLGEKKRCMEKLPAGVSASVAIATLDNILPVESSGVLQDIDGNELEPRQRLHSAVSYTYKVMRASFI